MPEESIDEFLKKVTQERKPLSEEEKREIMEVAREVWKKAMEKSEGKDSASLVNETSDTRQRLTVFRGEKVAMHKPKNPNIDLVIMSSREGSRIVDKYFFSPNEVTKTTFDLTGTRDIDIGKLTVNMGFSAEGLRVEKTHLEKSDPVVIRKQAKKQEERRTEVTYHPDKVDLEHLLSSLSSARLLTSNIDLS